MPARLLGGTSRVVQPIHYPGEQGDRVRERRRALVQVDQGRQVDLQYVSNEKLWGAWILISKSLRKSMENRENEFFKSFK